MAGKRIRSHDGPEEDRAHSLREDRGARKRKMRIKPQTSDSGLTKKDEARLKEWRGE